MKYWMIVESDGSRRQVRLTDDEYNAMIAEGVDIEFPCPGHDEGGWVSPKTMKNKRDVEDRLAEIKKDFPNAAY